MATYVVSYYLGMDSGLRRNDESALGKYMKKITFILLILFLMMGGFIIDIFFDNAASIDACLDQGGVWNYKLEECRYS